MTTYNYDNANRLTKKLNPDGGAVYFSYDYNGNLSSVTPPQRFSHLFDYNAMDLPSDYNPPVVANQNASTLYAYNLDRQLIQITRPDGSIIHKNYGSASGLLDSISTDYGNYTYNYVLNTDLISSLQSPDGISLSYTYAGNFPLTESTSGPISSELSYGYNTDGTLQSLTIQNAPVVVNYSYDKDALVNGVYNQSMLLNNFGAVGTTTVGSVTQKVSYNSFGESTRDLFTNSTGTVLSDRVYTRDNLGRVSTVAGLTYNYDTNGRLISVYSGSTLVRKYTYDLNGAWTQVIRNGVTTSAVVDAQDRLTTFGNFDYEYNPNGELTKKTEHTFGTTPLAARASGVSPSLICISCGTTPSNKITTYTYDTIGNLKTVTLPTGTVIEYIYDGKNRRVGKKYNGVLTQAFVYQNQTQIAAEFNGNGQIVRQFIYGTKSNIPDLMIYNGHEYKIISDQVGTPLLIVDTANGKAMTRYSYDEYGNFLSEYNLEGSIPASIPLVPISGQVSHAGVEVPFGFAGGVFDHDTVLVHFGARDYDPNVGRWIQKDPIGFKGGDTNLYAYSLLDPVNRFDPSGLLTQEDINNAISQGAKGAIKGAVIGLAVGACFPTAVGAIPGAIAGAAIGGLYGAGSALSSATANQLNQSIDNISP